MHKHTRIFCVFNRTETAVFSFTRRLALLMLIMKTHAQAIFTEVLTGTHQLIEHGLRTAPRVSASTPLPTHHCLSAPTGYNQA